MTNYIYKDKTYSSLLSLKRDNPHLIFSRDVSVELLNSIGITTKEVPDPVHEVDQMLVAKQNRNSEVASIVVDVDGMTFDGDESAQRRIANAILGWTDGVTSIKWVLHNNTVASVTKEQLQKALQLATAKMQEIWVVPYQTTETK